MRYLLNRNGWYFYDRRVPRCFARFDKRKRVRVGLNTQCQITAIKKIVAINDNIENHWQSLAQGQESHCPTKFNHMIRTARQMGFDYQPAQQVAELQLIKLLERVFTALANKGDELKVKAVLGTEEQKTTLKLSKALDKFWAYSKPKLLNKNTNQQRKWKNPRKRAVNYFIKAVGDKDIQEITNLDFVKFRDWWLKRVEKEGVRTDTVNKDFTHLKGILETVSDHEELNLDIDKVFKKIYLKEDDMGTRQAYDTDFIQDKILINGTLSDLNAEAQLIVHVCANTGARPIEVVNLVRQDIFLDAPVPYIHIRPRKGSYSLKTKQSERKLPLVGKALELFKYYPDGFKDYHGNSEMASRHINQWLTKHDLRPTQKHSLYSFRHSFQDRLNALELNDRIQCQLMGHKYQRPKYGSGATLEHLQKKMIKLSVV